MRIQVGSGKDAPPFVWQEPELVLQQYQPGTDTQATPSVRGQKGEELCAISRREADQQPSSFMSHLNQMLSQEGGMHLGSQHLPGRPAWAT